MSTTLLGSVMLAGITYATFSANAQGAAPSKTEAQGLASSVTVQVPLAPHDLPEPRIICGMKVWRPDPASDPGIYVPLPDGAADAKIRRIPATECVPGASTARREVFQSGTVYFGAVQLQPRPLIPADATHALALIPIVLGTAW